MEVKQVTTLAKLFRDSGDKILTSEFKLTLSGSLIRSLNDSFSLISVTSSNDSVTPSSSEFQLDKLSDMRSQLTQDSVANSSSSKTNLETSSIKFEVVDPIYTRSSVLQDLLLIHDFVQKTLSLCITNIPRDDHFREIVDLKKFRSLEKLEIQNFNVKQIVGIEKLRPQLKQIICVRCLQNVEEMIVYCGKDNAMGFAWKQLRNADFSYNNLRKCDKALEFASYLQVLNLSHNLLTSIEAIKWLPHLKVLNLSYNRLTSIPILHLEANRNLQILIVNNNLIDIINVYKLEKLTHFDISNNCLIDHTNLLPLSTFCKLKNLNLKANPIFCHPKHRENTAKYLHKNTSIENFILNFEPLTKYEKSLTGKIRSYNPLYGTRSSSTLNTSDILISSNRSDCGDNLSIASSNGSYKFDNSILLKRTDSTKVLYKHRDIIDSDSENNQNSNSKRKENGSYIETKNRIEQIRKEYGAKWLQEKSAREMYESVLGIENKVSEETEKINPNDLISELLTTNITNNESSVDNFKNLTSTPVNNSPILNETFESPIRGEKVVNDEEDVSSSKIVSTETVYDSANDSSINNVENTIYKSIQNEATPNENLLFTDCDSFQESKREEAFEHNDDPNDIFVVQVDDKDDLSLTISETHIGEFNSKTKTTMEKWNINFLESCDRIKSDTLRINFDTIIQDKKERVYKLNPSLCQEIEKYLRDILSRRRLSEMNQILYRCTQCSFEFSTEKPKDFINEIDVKCLQCQSKFVAELYDENLEKLPDMKSFSETIKQFSVAKSVSTSESDTGLEKEKIEKKDKEQKNNNLVNDNKVPLVESASHSSIGSAGSLNESSSCSKISQNSFDSNQSVAGSSSNERDNDFNSMGFNNSNYYNDSDVEILSNPSQSSIEVLDQLQSSRKTSEERRISRIPSLETIEDNSIRNFSFKIGDDTTTVDLITGFGLVSDNNKTITSQDSTAQFLRNEIKQTINDEKINLKTSLTNTELKQSMDKPTGIIEKKISIGNINLTESSSSGSVTDSICTTYEQENKNDNDLVINENKDVEFVSSILGGLFQAPYKLASMVMKTNNSEISNPVEKFKFNYTDYSDIDHRLKLFIMDKFNKNEFFEWTIKGKIFDAKDSRYFQGIIVLSTKKMYIMEISGVEVDDPSKWLKDILSVHIAGIQSLQLLPFKTGLSISINNFTGNILLILQDILRTDRLMLFFDENPLPNNCTLDREVSEIVMSKLLFLTKKSTIKMFAILNSCTIRKSEDIVQTISPTAFFITDQYLYITNEDLSWLSESFHDDINVNSLEKMSYLKEITMLEQNRFEILFVDDRIGDEETWVCEFETQENTDTFLNAIKQSWEKLFGVPLVINKNIYNS